MSALVWRLAHPAAPNWQAVLPEPGGVRLVGLVCRYDAPAGGEHWIGSLWLHDITGRLATADEAKAAVEAHYNERIRP